MSSRLDIVAIGNPMVDSIIKASTEQINQLNIKRDSMNLISEEDKNNFQKNFTIEDMVAGGSACNTIVGASSLGATGSYIGKINDDELGNFLIKDLHKNNVNFPLGPSQTNISTGLCTVFVEPDATRTMCTYLGTGSLISENDIISEHIKGHNLCYIEGYLWDNTNAKNAIKKMIKFAKEDKQKICLTLSDKFCIERHLQSFQNLVSNGIDYLFCNEDEFLMFNETDYVEAILKSQKLPTTFIVTRGTKGSTIISKGKVINSLAIDVPKVIDRNGAGDLFAAGFLFGLAQNKTLDECAKLGSIAAAEIIAHFGARPQIKLSSLI